MNVFEDVMEGCGGYCIEECGGYCIEEWCCEHLLSGLIHMHKHTHTHTQFLNSIRFNATNMFDAL